MKFRIARRVFDDLAGMIEANISEFKGTNEFEGHKISTQAKTKTMEIVVNNNPSSDKEYGVAMSVTNNDDLAMKIRLMLNHSEAVVNDMERKNISILPEYEYMYGMNMRMTELSAAVARAQLKKLDGILKRVREHAKYFDVKVREGCEHSYYRYAWHGGMVGYTMSEWDEIERLFNVRNII